MPLDTLYGPQRNRCPSNPPPVAVCSAYIQQAARNILRDSASLSARDRKAMISSLARSLKADGLAITVRELTEEVARQARVPQLGPIEDRMLAQTRPGPGMPMIDRMLRYSRNPHCPECDAHPVVGMLRRPGYRKFRCRVCDHVWEVVG